MRILELSIYLFTLIYLGADIVVADKNRRWKSYLAFIPLILVVVHVVVEGYRWQMFIAYLVAIVIAVATGIRIKRTEGAMVARRKRHFIAKVIGLLLFMITMVFPLLFPVVRLPEPMGPYSVGTTMFDFTDVNREEAFTADEDDVRELAVRAWYPIDDGKGYELSSYVDMEDVRNGAYEGYYLPGNYMNEYLTLSKANAYVDAPISNEQKNYPVILYSHGYYGVGHENTILCEELASNGYVVFSIAHTYEVFSTVYEDDRVTKVELTYFESLNGGGFSENDYERLIDALWEEQDLSAKEELVYKYMKEQEILVKLMEERVLDVKGVLDELEYMNDTSDFFEGVLDLEHIGMIGWSLGGATAIEAGHTDGRIDAVVSMDGWPYGGYFTKEVVYDTPLLLLVAEMDEGKLGEAYQLIWDMLSQKVKAQCSLVEIPETTHQNFTDLPTLIELVRYFEYYGKIDPEEMNLLHHDQTVRFLDEHLK